MGGHRPWGCQGAGGGQASVDVTGHGGGRGWAGPGGGTGPGAASPPPPWGSQAPGVSRPQWRSQAMGVAGGGQAPVGGQRSGGCQGAGGGQPPPPPVPCSVASCEGSWLLPLGKVPALRVPRRRGSPVVSDLPHGQQHGQVPRRNPRSLGSWWDRWQDGGARGSPLCQGVCVPGLG